jgi:hypothetical protein
MMKNLIQTRPGNNFSKHSSNFRTLEFFFSSFDTFAGKKIRDCYYFSYYFSLVAKIVMENKNNKKMVAETVQRLPIIPIFIYFCRFFLKTKREDEFKINKKQC